MADGDILRVPYDTAADLNANTPYAAELVYDTTNGRVRWGDGSTLGGNEIAGTADIPAISTDDPQDLGVAAAGTTGETSDAAHVHAMPSAADVGAAAAAHAAGHTNGTDDIQTATAAQKGVMSAAAMSKLDGIEASADVTDATNVAAAGAVMDGDFTANGAMERTGAGTYATILNKRDATEAPDADNDVDEGYSVGSRWIDVTNDKEYVCLDNTDGAAVWTETTQSGGAGSGDVTGPADSTQYKIPHWGSTEKALEDGTTLTDGQIVVGQTGAAPLAKTMSGDATLAATGALTIASQAVTLAKLINASAQYQILARKSASAGSFEPCSLTEVLDFVTSAAQGDILYRGASDWARLAAGLTGQFLVSGGTGANPYWASGPPETIVKSTVSGSAVTTIALGSAFDLSTFGHEVIFMLKNATNSATKVSLYFNNDTTDANYDRAVQYGGSYSGGTLSAASAELLSMATNCSGKTGLAIARIEPDSSSNGWVLCQFGVCDYASGQFYVQNSATIWLGAANVTRLDLVHSVASGIDVGSWAIVKRSRR